MRIIKIIIKMDEKKQSIYIVNIIFPILLNIQLRTLKYLILLFIKYFLFKKKNNISYKSLFFSDIQDYCNNWKNTINSLILCRVITSNCKSIKIYRLLRKLISICRNRVTYITLWIRIKRCNNINTWRIIRIKFIF